ncbi:MAG: methylated-DNA--[protein]-cysteine S-methyltransferase [Acetobacteraceae bacterium]|nr:methylated-DNA--[protein]-cysteine S-methyltransferase [Acetobacteraceae bacterium]
MDASLIPARDDPRLAAFVARDRSQRGRFVVGVTSTRIYCAPGCPAKMPKLANLRIFSSPAEAEAAGFRACRRCDPKGAGVDLAAQVVADASAFIAAAEAIPSLAVLAKRAGYSPWHFLRIFRAHTGLTPRAFAESVRAARLARAIGGAARVADAAYDAGFGSEARVHANAARDLGMRARSARRGGEGELIRYAFADGPLGRTLLAATDKGVCFVGFGEVESALLANMRSRFRNARFEPAPEALAGHLATVTAMIEEPKVARELPLDLRGTLFQRRVWEALRRIPRGRTSTYGRIAAELGMPKGARAVGAAIGANPVSVAVPCHRVIGSDGSLTGYEWGIPRKQRLLAVEGARIEEEFSAPASLKR